MTNSITEQKQSRRGEIIIATIGLIGVLVTATLSNWDKVFGSKPSSGADPRVTTQPAFPIFINGSVSDAKGNQLKGVLIQLVDHNTGKQVGNTDTTDPNGSFTLQIQSSDLENRLLRVSAKKDNLEPAGTVQLGQNHFTLSIVLSDQQESP